MKKVQQVATIRTIAVHSWAIYRQGSFGKQDACDSQSGFHDLARTPLGGPRIVVDVRGGVGSSSAASPIRLLLVGV
jgi:hypothetical protein